MKNLFTFLSAFLFLITANAQGSIIGFTMSPANPTTSDTVYIYADLRFTSGDCELDYLSQAVSGFDINANTHHCWGPLTFICSAVDTFKINPLPAGNYNFNLNLTSGGAPAPCTPGIIADDDSTFNFTVSSGPVGIIDIPTTQLTTYPNPIHNQLNVSLVPNGTMYRLLSISGQVVKTGLINNNVINNLDSLPTGCYFLKIETKNGTIVRKIIKA